MTRKWGEGGIWPKFPDITVEEKPQKNLGQEN